MAGWYNPLYSMAAFQRCPYRVIAECIMAEFFPQEAWLAAGAKEAIRDTLTLELQQDHMGLSVYPKWLRFLVDSLGLQYPREAPVCHVPSGKCVEDMQEEIFMSGGVRLVFYRLTNPESPTIDANAVHARYIWWISTLDLPADCWNHRLIMKPGGTIAATGGLTLFAHLYALVRANPWLTR